MINGVVKWFNSSKGYGFIEQEDGPDVFVHHTGINSSGFRTLNEGDRVTFEIAGSQRTVCGQRYRYLRGRTDKLSKGGCAFQRIPLLQFLPC